MKTLSGKAVLAIVLVGALWGISCQSSKPAVVQNSSPSAGGATATAPADKAPAAAAKASAVVVDHLPNGMTVIVKPYRAVPVVTVRAYVRTGTLYEGPWLGAGISHLTEHLVASGAEGLTDAPPAPGATPKPDRVAIIGGQCNAYTSMDHTCYYISAAASKADDCIDLIADWMARPDFDKSDFTREHGVVQRELEMGKDDPGRQLAYAHMANVFLTHPAAVPAIGFEAPLSKLTFEDIQAYHKLRYVPEAMVFVVVGDVDPQAVLAQVRKAFADFPATRMPSFDIPPVPPIVGVRRVVKVQAALKETLEECSFPAIPLLHPDLYALDVLSTLLGEGSSSRLIDRVQRQQKLVTDISTSSWTPAWGRGVFSVSMRAEPGKIDAAEKAALAEFKSIIDSGVSKDELERAKRQKVAEFVHAQQTVESQAGTLGSDYLSTGDLNFSRDYTDKIQAVTAEQIRDAARKYFNFDNMVITRLVPPAGGQAESAAATHTEKTAATAFTMPNGLRVVLQPVQSGDSAGLVSMAFVTEGGLLLETDATNGIGSLMTDLCTKGTPSLSAQEIAEFFDSAGGSLKGECGNNAFYWQATVLDDSFKRALEIFSDVVCRPTLAAKELDTRRPLHLAAIAQVDEQWQSQLFKFCRQQFFTNSPYGMLPSGKTAVVKAASVEQVRQHYRKSLLAGGSVLTIYGHFDPAVARTAVERLFSDVPSGRLAVVSPPERVVEAKGETHLLKTANKVAGIMVASPGMKVSNIDDRVAIDVLDTLISGFHLPAGWLHKDLRGRQLVYVVHAYNWPGLAPGAFFTYAACRPDNASQVVDIIHRDLRKASDYLPSQKDLDQAVNTILTAEQLENQSIPSLAMSAALDELYGLGYDYRWKMESRYRSLKPEDIRQVGRKYLSGPYVTVVTSPLGNEALQAPASQPTLTTAPTSQETDSAE
ncbi:MAG: pitrilysin family protein [Phycisphaerae bacterium]|jgi:zinc protease